MPHLTRWHELESMAEGTHNQYSNSCVFMFLSIFSTSDFYQMCYCYRKLGIWSFFRICERPCSLIGSDTPVRESEPIREHSLPRTPKFRTLSHTASHILSCDCAPTASHTTSHTDRTPTASHRLIIGYWFHSYLDQMCHISLISCCESSGYGWILNMRNVCPDVASDPMRGAIQKNRSKHAFMTLRV